MESKLINPTVPFCTGVAHQKYLSAEKGLQTAVEGDCTHWYIDGSLFGEMVDDWTEARIVSLQAQIEASGVRPIFHGNFKAPLGSDVEAFRVAAVEYVKKKRSISPAVWARR